MLEVAREARLEEVHGVLRRKLREVPVEALVTVHAEAHEELHLRVRVGVPVVVLEEVREGLKVKGASRPSTQRETICRRPECIQRSQLSLPSAMNY